MKFDVKALRAAAEKTMKADRAAWDAKRSEEEAALDGERAAWVEKWGPAWAAAAKVIAAKVRRGQPIVAEDLPRDRFSSAEVWHDGRTRLRAEFKPSPDLAALLQVLDVVAEGYVTAAGLRNLGVGSSTLGRCMRHMAHATVKG